MAAHPKTRHTGFTLVELLVAIGVLGVLMALAYPSFSETMTRNRLAAQNNELMAAMTLARTEAIRRNAPVALCAANAAQSACQNAWSRDWLVWQDTNRNGAVNAGEEIIQVGGVTANEQYLADTATHNVIRFNARGLRELPAATPVVAVVLEMRPNTCTSGKPWRRRISVLVTGAMNPTTSNCP